MHSNRVCEENWRSCHLPSAPEERAEGSQGQGPWNGQPTPPCAPEGRTERARLRGRKAQPFLAPLQGAGWAMPLFPGALPLATFRSPLRGGRQIVGRRRFLVTCVAVLLCVWIAGALPALAAPARGESSAVPDALLWVAYALWLPLAVCCFTALALILWVLAPAPLAATCQAIRAARGRCLITGAAAAVVVLGLVSLLSRYPGVPQVISALLLGSGALGGVAGLTAVTALVGTGALELAGRTGTRGVSVMVGAVLTVLAGVIPIVGWALCLYFVLIGLGGLLRACIRSK